MKVYFAHSTWIYGSRFEKEMIEALKMFVDRLEKAQIINFDFNITSETKDVPTRYYFEKRLNGFHEATIKCRFFKS
jgi:hypothetical protein